jgi:hypothetical protein
MESFDTFLILDTQSNIGTTTECILKRCAEPKTRTQLKASEMSEKICPECEYKSKYGLDKHTCIWIIVVSRSFNSHVSHRHI